MNVHHSEDCGETRSYKFRNIRFPKIRFSVKAERDAAVCLSSSDHDESDMYEIFIGCWGGGESGIRRGRDDDVVKVDTPDILSPDEFNEFWITVRRGVVKVGKKGKRRPFMSFEDPEKLEDIEYYGYSTGWGAEGDWMFKDEKKKEGSSSSSSSSSSSAASSSDSEAEELNAMEERPVMYKRPAKWVSGNGGYMPHNPVSAGEGPNGTVYVGMTRHEGGHLLGMVVPEEALCYVPFEGEVLAEEKYFVLGTSRRMEMKWQAASGGSLAPGAIQGGHTVDGEPLYIGRVAVDGLVSCGGIQISKEACIVTYDGAVHSHRDYEVLCAKELPCRFRI